MRENKYFLVHTTSSPGTTAGSKYSERSLSVLILTHWTALTTQSPGKRLEASSLSSVLWCWMTLTRVVLDDSTRVVVLDDLTRVALDVRVHYHLQAWASLIQPTDFTILDQTLRKLNHLRKLYGLYEADLSRIRHARWLPPGWRLIIVILYACLAH